MWVSSLFALAPGTLSPSHEGRSGTPLRSSVICGGEPRRRAPQYVLGRGVHPRLHSHGTDHVDPNHIVRRKLPPEGHPDSSSTITSKTSRFSCAVKSCECQMTVSVTSASKRVVTRPSSARPTTINRAWCAPAKCAPPTGTALVGGVSKERPLAVIPAARKRDTAAQTKRSARSEVSTSIANFDSGRIALRMNSWPVDGIVECGAATPESMGSWFPPWLDVVTHSLSTGLDQPLYCLPLGRKLYRGVWRRIWV
jgi:hypothetical protein